MDNIIVRNYDITSPDIYSNKKIAFLSDVHSNNLKLEKIYELLYKMNISVLLIGGDLIDTIKCSRNDAIKELLFEMSKTMDIYISMGNHDIFPIRCEKDLIHILTYFGELSLSDNIHVSDFPIDSSTADKWSLDNNVDIVSVNMPLNYYKHREPYYQYEELIRAIDSISVDIDKFNILLCHSPKNIVLGKEIDKYIKKVKNFNLILSGHMHAGLVPQAFRNRKSGPGLFGPYHTLFPDHAYGVIEDGNSVSITTGGVVKIAKKYHESILHITNHLYPPEVEVINLKSDPKNSFTRKKVMYYRNKN